MEVDLSAHKRVKYILFCSLYFSEGLYQALILIVTPLYLLGKNVPIPIVTIISGIGYIPWGLKFVWGGIIDFYYWIGRKRFAVYGTIIGATGFFLLTVIDTFFSIILFAIFLLLGYTGIGFLDSATDAWAIDISKKNERGKINSSMVIGKWVGQYIGALLIIILAALYGYAISFLIGGFIILVLALIPLNVTYQIRRNKKLNIWGLVKKEFKKSITRRTVLYFFIIVLQHALYFTFLVLYLKVILNFDDVFIGYIFAFWLIVVVPGSLLGGVIADKFGRKKPLYLFLIMLMISSVIPIFLTDVFLLLFTISVTLFFLNAVIPFNWAIIMDIINPKIGAFEHEIICSIVNFGSIIMGSATGTLFVVIGFENIFILSGLITLIALLFLSMIKGIDEIKLRT